MRRFGIFSTSIIPVVSERGSRSVLGAVTQQEIGLSIMAEVVHARRGGSLGHLRLVKLLERSEKTHEAKKVDGGEPGGAARERSIAR
jgi:hypothetical protein